MKPPRQTSLNTCQPPLGESKDDSRDLRDISSRPVLGVSLPERTTAATNIASDLPEGKEGHVGGVYPKTPTTQRIAAAIGRDDHCQNCDEPLVAAIPRITICCPTCTSYIEENVAEIAQNGWEQIQCVQCDEPMVVDIDSYRIACSQCGESNNAN